MRHSYDTEALEAQLFGSSGGGTGTQEAETAGMGAEETAEAGLLWTKDPVVMEVTLEDGTQREYTVAGVFLEGEKEYIALEDREGDIDIMELSEGEAGEPALLPIEDKEEQERAAEAFDYYFEQPEAENQNRPEREKEDDRDQDREEN